ncbi:tail fiber domain-containing protein [Candidatus Margulisiibacteriota bacterium]
MNISKSIGIGLCLIVTMLCQQSLAVLGQWKHIDRSYVQDNHLYFKGVHAEHRGGWEMVDDDWVRTADGFNIATLGRIFIKGDLIYGIKYEHHSIVMLPELIVADSIVTNFNSYFNTLCIGSIGDLDAVPHDTYDTYHDTGLDGLYTAGNNHTISQVWAGWGSNYLYPWQHFNDISAFVTDEPNAPENPHKEDWFLNYNNVVVYNKDDGSSLNAKIGQDRLSTDVAMDRRRNFAIAQRPDGGRLCLNMAALNKSTVDSLDGGLGISFGNSEKLTINSSKKVGIGSPPTPGTGVLKVNGDFSLSNLFSTKTNMLFLGDQRNANSMGLAYSNVSMSSYGLSNKESLVFFSNDQIRFQNNNGSFTGVEMDVSGTPTILFRGTLAMYDNHIPWSNWDFFLFNYFSAPNGYKNLHVYKPMTIGIYKELVSELTPHARLYFNGFNLTNANNQMYVEKHQELTNYSEMRIAIGLTNSSSYRWEIGAEDDSSAPDSAGQFFPAIQPLVWFKLDGTHGFTDTTPGPIESPDLPYNHDDTYPLYPLTKSDFLKGKDFFAGRIFTASGASLKASDVRLKTDIGPLRHVLSSIMALKGLSYNKISKEDASSISTEEHASLLSQFLDPDKSYDFFKKNYSSEVKNNYYGLAAQEVARYFPAAAYQDQDGFFELDYESLIPVLIKAVQERQEIIAHFKKELRDIKLHQKTRKQNKL